MALKTKKLRFLFTIVALLIATTVAYGANTSKNNTLRLSTFSSKEAAQKFYKSIPEKSRATIQHDQLFLSISQNAYDFGLYHIDINDIEDEVATKICAYVEENDFRCRRFKQQSFDSFKPEQKASITKIVTATPEKTIEKSKSITPSIMRAAKETPTLSNYKPSESSLLDQEEELDVLSNYREPDVTEEAGFDRDYSIFLPIDPSKAAFDLKDDSYSFVPHDFDTPKEAEAKAGYIQARTRFLNAVRNIGEGVNAGNADEVAQAELMKIGQTALEDAGSAYFYDVMNKYRPHQKSLDGSEPIHEKFVHQIRQNFSNTVEETARGLVSNTLSGGDEDVLEGKVDALVLKSIRSVIDTSISEARKSDLYLLRNIEFEYNLNDFEDTYFSVLGIQPIHQSDDFRHNFFFQGSAIVNEDSVDIINSEKRHTLNLGAAYRYLTPDEQTLLGANVFFDHQWPYHHSRVSVGVDAQSDDLSLAANYYVPITGFKDGRTDNAGTAMEETALQGYDVEVGYDVPQVKNLKVFGKGYQYFRDKVAQDDLFGFELSAEYAINDNFKLRGALIEENGGRDGVEVALQYSVPLYDVNDINIAHEEMKKSSMRSKIFDKVRRENRIRIGERVNANAVSAQFSGASLGLPFDVGGTATGAGVDLPFNTPITVPNGDFGIITFNNGAIANISASGAGDVILEFNATTLTVTATNGGFVQFISGSGGITTVNVPGGTVNLLGTDIDVTDDGTTTTIQVRAGAINVVPAVGVAVLGGSQADVVSLGIASGATALMTNPALETRQEAAFTSLDLMNPAPVASEKEAPFINALPVLITGPQFVGNNADLQVTFTQPVTVAGAPQITGFIDANARTFIYDAGASSSTQLVFRHVYIASDVGAANMTVQSLDLNGGTIIGSSNGLNAITAFTDTVLAINDATAPMLASSTPVDNEPALPSSDNVVLTFNENIQANAGNITLTDTTDGSDTRIIPIGDPQITIAGATLTINPTGILDLSTDYDLTIPANVIQDTSGNPFAGIATTQLNFTTSNDITPPALTSTTPADNATSVATNANITLTYDDNAIIGTGSITIHRTANNAILETIAVGSANVTGGGTTTITINPTSDLPPATEVYALVDAGAFEDANGNGTAAISSTTALSFRTFSPLDLSNISLWLDGDDIDGDAIPEGAAEAGIISGNIDTWVDKSGNGNDTRQTIAGDRPAFANPGANFVGTTNSASSGDFMQITNSGASGQTVIAVLENVTQNVSGTVNAFLDSAGSDYTFLRVSSTDYKISLDGAAGRQGRVALDGDSFTANGGNIASPGPFPTEALLYTEYATVLSPHEILGGLSTGGGAVDLSPDFRSNFIIRELIMYSDTKTSDLAGIDEREMLEGYLAHKYGVTARLPVSHPFKSIAP